jgi:folate-dependent phosphoribosylglycinamide formyltransferase PurN
MPLDLVATTNDGEHLTEVRHVSPGDRIVVLTGGGPLPWIMTHALTERFGPITILEEDKEPLSVMVRRRSKMLGRWQAMGQVAFGIWLKLLHRISISRKQEIIAQAGLSPVAPTDCRHIQIGDVNSDACRDALRKLKPDVVVVLGTRMIKSATLRSVDACFINYHAGLNPKYRGMNGGYWALAMGDRQNFGVTLHLVDEGVDTGSVISYRTLTPARQDNFTTYPLLQAAAGRPLLIEAVGDALNGRLKTINVPLPSKQWFHPTLWGYIATGLSKGVW